MKKLLAILLALTLVLALAGCETAPYEEPDYPEPQTTEPAPVTEPAVTTEGMIEISEFCPEEDMPDPFGDETPAEFSDSTYEIVVDVCVYTPDWLYYHNIYDWRTAGITFDDINAVSDDLLALPFNADALAAFRQKISEFTLIMMLEAPADINTSAPAITIDDEVYDVAWLSSHNATEYKEVGIPAETVREYLEVLSENFWYTYEYRWIEEVYARLTK